MEHYCRHCKTLVSEHENSDEVECSYCIRMFVEMEQEKGLQCNWFDNYPHEPCPNCGKYPDGSVRNETSL